MSEPFDPIEDMKTCDFCEGSFLPDDMDGDHCLACADELFNTND